MVGQSSLPTDFYNCLLMSGSGSYSFAGFSFNAAVTPVVVEGATQTSIDIEVVSYSYSSIVLSVIEGVTGVLTSGIVGMIIGSTVASLIGNEVSQAGLSALPTSGQQPIPGIPGWSITYAVTCMVVQELDPQAAEIDVFASAAVQGPPSLPMPQAVFQLSSAPHDLKDLSPIVVTMSISDSGLLNPSLGLRISWSAVRADTGQTVLSQDMPLSAAAAHHQHRPGDRRSDLQ